MGTSLLRLVFATVWVMGSLFLWSIPCSLAFFLIDYHWRGVETPYGLDIAFAAIATSGILVISSAVAVLAIRGRLPGTAHRPVSLYMLAWLAFIVLFAVGIRVIEITVLGKHLDGPLQPYQLALFGLLTAILMFGLWIIERGEIKGEEIKGEIRGDIQV